MDINFQTADTSRLQNISVLLLVLLLLLLWWERERRAYDSVGVVVGFHIEWIHGDPSGRLFAIHLCRDIEYQYLG